MYGYLPYSDCGSVELRLGNVQKNALANKEAICIWLRLIVPLVWRFKRGTEPVTKTGSCRAS